MAHCRPLRIVTLLLGTALLPASAGAERQWCTVATGRARAVLETTLFDPQSTDANPHPLTDLHTGGLPHRGNWDTVHSAAQDWTVMLRAALAWRAGAGTARYEVARRMLIAWTDTYKPTLNPIDETGLDALIETFAILKEKLSTAERKRIQGWLDSWGQAYVESIERFAQPDHSIWINNWQSHRIKLITMIAASTEDRELFDEARRLFRLQLAANIHPDGETLDFAVRDALHYVVYDLEPLLRAALTARGFAGEDWYDWETPDHVSLARAVAWLTPYASGKATHEEFVHSQIDFDAERAAAGVRGYKGPFDVRDSATLYWLASRFDPTLESLAGSLGKEPEYLAMCGN